MMLDILITTGELFGGLTVAAGVTAVTATGRRVLTAILRYGKANLPAWALTVFGICLLVPGPFDEMVVLPILIAVALRDRRRRQIFRRYMWVAFHPAK